MKKLGLIGRVVGFITLVLCIPALLFCSETTKLSGPAHLGGDDCYLSLTAPQIKTVVKQAFYDASDFYLQHDPDGKWSFLGTPYIDARTSLSHKHILIYAHHIYGTNLAFSSLAKVNEAFEWQKLGKLHISSAYMSDLVYEPFCASNIDENNETIQSFVFSSDDMFNRWLANLAESSDVKNEFLAQNNHWTQAVTLCTCSERYAGKARRCIVTFVR